MPAQWEVRPKDYYAILQIRLDAEPEVVEGAYKRLIAKYHPDKVRTPEERPRFEQKAKDINEAFEVLKDTTKRRDYDVWYRWERPSGPRRDKDSTTSTST